MTSVLRAAHCIDPRCRRNGTILSIRESATNNLQEFLRGKGDRFVIATSTVTGRSGNEAGIMFKRPIEKLAVALLLPQKA
jgi:hypothetical protein